MFQTRGVMAQANAIRLPFPTDFFHCVMTSPPYWGMREYSGGEQARAWGGDPTCKHDFVEERSKVQTGGLSEKQLSNKGVDGSGWMAISYHCSICSMWIGELGMEPTPELYIEHIVEVCQDVRRVMRPDGVFWLNIGDSQYKHRGHGQALPEGSLTMTPHRVALALQADGWVVREDAVWSKPNPMVESVTGWRWERHRIKIASADVDWRAEAARGERSLRGPTNVAGGNTAIKGFRPKWKTCPGCEDCDPHSGYVFRRGSWRHTRSHEFIFQLATDMKYFVDQSLVLEETSETSHGALEPGAGKKQADLQQNQGPTTMGIKTELRNPRSVFHVTSGIYKGAHTATYPEELIVNLIRAACPTRSCEICRKAWAPVMDLDHEMKPKVKVGYRRSCEHADAGFVAGWVLDPFFGSGTTGAVARSVGVNFAGVDIAYDYLSENARVRAFGQTPPKALDDLPLFTPAS